LDQIFQLAPLLNGIYNRSEVKRIVSSSDLRSPSLRIQFRTFLNWPDPLAAEKLNLVFVANLHSKDKHPLLGNLPIDLNSISFSGTLEFRVIHYSSSASLRLSALYVKCYVIIHFKKNSFSRPHTAFQSSLRLTLDVKGFWPLISHLRFLPIGAGIRDQSSRGKFLSKLQRAFAGERKGRGEAG
jgi:hypothetical protein